METEFLGSVSKITSTESLDDYPDKGLSTIQCIEDWLPILQEERIYLNADVAHDKRFCGSCLLPSVKWQLTGAQFRSYQDPIKMSVYIFYLFVFSGFCSLDVW